MPQQVRDLYKIQVMDDRRKQVEKCMKCVNHRFSYQRGVICSLDKPVLSIHLSTNFKPSELCLVRLHETNSILKGMLLEDNSLILTNASYTFIIQ